jgi:hypothetical protein
MNRKQAIAIEIALQTHVLRTCPIHGEIYCDDEVDPAAAFALAVELVKEHTPYVNEFQDDAHELTDLLSETISVAPDGCRHCSGVLTQDLANAAAARSVWSRVGRS